MTDGWTRPFGYFAAAGLVASFLVHLVSLAGFDAQIVVPPVLALHGGVFVAFVPMMLMNVRVARIHGFNADRTTALRALFANVPLPVAGLVAVLFVYGFVNFFLVGDVGGTGGAVTFQGDQAIVARRNLPPEVMDAATYHARQAKLLRAFSGHWMLFYGASMALLLWPPSRVGPS